jgi:hypothetical protein
VGGRSGEIEAQRERGDREGKEERREREREWLEAAHALGVFVLE